MIVVAQLTPASTMATTLIAAGLMVGAGLSRKRLEPRPPADRRHLLRLRRRRRFR